jgi:hypothetical protein
VVFAFSDIRDNNNYDTNTSIFWLQGNIDLNPLFADANLIDFRLKSMSPCIDAGIQDTIIVYNDGQDTIYIPQIDYIGAAPDMGAYEYGDPTIVKEQAIFTASHYSLHQNYPNPFNPVTMINYQLPMTNDVELSIFNVLGQKVATLVSEKQNAGYHQVEWDASRFSSGIYYYKIQAGEFVDVRKMILIR